MRAFRARSDDDHSVYSSYPSCIQVIVGAVADMEVGTVGYFNKTAGYGFISSEATTEDVFFHMNEVGDEDPTKGQQVLFEYEHTEEGPRATALSLSADADARTETVDSAHPDDPRPDRSQANESDPQGDSGTLRIPSRTDSKAIQRADSDLAETRLEAGDLAYLELSHDGASLGERHPFRDSFTLLIGSGNCPELEEALHGTQVGTEGRFEVSTADGTVRAPPLSADVVEPQGLAGLAKDAGVETVQEFVELSGDALIEGYIINTDQLTDIQNEMRSLVEAYELVEYEIVDAIRWRDPPEDA